MNQDEIAKFKKDLRLYVDEPPFVPLKRKRTRSNGEGSIRKKGTGWEGRYTAGYGPDGKQIRKSVYAETRKECNEKLQAAIKKAAAERTLEIPDTSPTLSEWLRIWLNEYRKDLRSLSHKRYLALFEKVDTFPMHEKKLNEVLPIELQQFINSFISYGSCNRAIGILKAALQAALDNGYLPRNPAASLRNPLPVNDPKFEQNKKAFTLKEEADFVAAIADNPFRPIYLLSLYAGLRRGEAVALTWDKIDLDKRQIRVTEAASRGAGKGYSVGKTKTSTSVRVVPICRALEKELEKVPDKTGYLCVNHEGGMLNADILTMDFAAIMKRLGQKHTFHHLRHTFATRCGEKGINIKVVQSWLGHASSDMTMNVYTHATDDLMTAELSKLD